MSNLRFAQFVEPENQAIQEKLMEAQEKRAKGEPTIPSLMADELRTNPFLRVHEPSILSRYPGKDAAEVMGMLREAKNGFS